MTTSDENFDPHSLPNLSNLLTHSARKQNNKRIVHKGTLTSPGLKQSFQHNVTTHDRNSLQSGVDVQLSASLSSSQSMAVSRHKAMEELRLPISPPPEEEMRIKELSVQGTTLKDPSSRLPVRSRPGASKASDRLQYFPHFHQQADKPANGGSVQRSPTASAAASTSTTSKSNPRKRTRSALPSLHSCGDSTTIPIASLIPSPNPKARKQPKKHDTGEDTSEDTGSGFKTRHKCDTSAKSLDSPDDGHFRSPAGARLRSPARRKRQEPGVENYTPQRKRASVSTSQGSPTKRQPRAGRSTTPDVRYEPPTEQFTPPRDVVLQIPSSLVSSRSRKPRPSSYITDGSSIDKRVVKVKAERFTSPFPLPPLDLSKPVPPPSPTDDPLLLVGTPVIVRRSATPIVVGDDTTHDTDHNHLPSAPAPVAFDFDQSTGSHIFHSDDEDTEAGEDEGEFTGRFKFYSVPVKQDPPSSATRARRESWGRPISPFPFAKRSSGSQSQGATIWNSHIPSDEDSPPPSPSAGHGRSVLLTQELEVNSSTLETPGKPSCTRGFTEPEYAYDDDDGFHDEVEPPPGVVEVSSDNPKAAARAAAILKLHHSYIVDGLVAQRARRRSSHGFLRRASFSFGDRNMDVGHKDEFICHARRKRIAASAGVMQHRPRPMVPSLLAPSTFISPGSPFVPVISPEDALREAETEIRAASVSPGRPRTPLRSISLTTGSSGHCVTAPPSLTVKFQRDTEEPLRRTKGAKDWTKAYWKTLDMCFTDERLAVGSAMGLGMQLAEVDDIEIGSVAERFLAQNGGEDWDRDMLLRRATALSARQRAGNGAPPSSGRLIPRNTNPESVAPVFTPLAVYRPLSPTIEAVVPTKVPPSLLAPRYAHLHQELTTSTSTLPEIPPPTPRSSTSETDTTGCQTQAVDFQESQSSGLTVQSHASGVGDPVPTSATKRVLSYLGSFVGRSGITVSSVPTVKPRSNALPLPPPEMRQVVRGPIHTPTKKPIPKSQPPRDLIHLTETQLPTKPSQFPKAKSAKEMVNLNHVEPPRSVQRPRTASGPIIIPGRTSKNSGGSVKDLVRSFEAAQKNTEEEIKRSNSRLAVRKIASVGNLDTRPVWKP